MCVHTYMHICNLHVYMYTYIHARAYIHACICVYTSMHLI